MKYIVISVLLTCILMDVVLGISKSKSCTLVEGKWKCEEMIDRDGSSASAASAARSGPQPADFRHVATGNQDRYNQYSSGSGFQQPYESESAGSEPSGSQPAGSRFGGYQPQPDVFQPFLPFGPFYPYGASSGAAASASSNQGQPSHSFASSSATHDAPIFVPAHDSQGETPGDHDSQEETPGDHASQTETPVDHASHTETGHSGPSNADGVTVTSTSGEGNFPGFFYPGAYAVPGAAFAGSGAYAAPGVASAGSGAWSGLGTSAGSGAWAGQGAYPGAGAWAGPNFGFPFGFGTYAIARRRR